MPKPVLLICGCEKYRASLEAALLRFARPDVWDLVGCIGRPDLPAPEYDASANIVYLPVSDVYEELPSKIHAAISWIVTWRPDALGIFKTDEDIFVENLADLETAIRTHMNVPYWGFVKSETKEKRICPSRVATRFHDKTIIGRHQGAEYCYGAGYWVSKAAIPYILAAADIYRGSFMEDICTGFVLNQANIIPIGVAVKYKERNR